MNDLRNGDTITVELIYVHDAMNDDDNIIAASKKDGQFIVVGKKDITKVQHAFSIGDKVKEANSNDDTIYTVIGIHKERIWVENKYGSTWVWYKNRAERA